MPFHEGWLDKAIEDFGRGVTVSGGNVFGGILEAVGATPRGVLETIIPQSRGFFENLPAVGGAGASAAPVGIQAGGAAPYQGGGVQAMAWPDTFGNGFGNGGGFPLTVAGPRRLIPYAGGGIPSGYRVAQRPPRRPTAGTAGGWYLVPRRTMNPLNPKALMRAERRMNSFTTWVKRHFRIAAAAPKRRKGGKFTKRRR